MRVVFGLVLVLGLGLAGFAVYMAKNYIQTYQAELEKERRQSGPTIETTEVLVADRALSYGGPRHQRGYPAGQVPAELCPKASSTPPRRSARR